MVELAQLFNYGMCLLDSVDDAAHALGKLFVSATLQKRLDLLSGYKGLMQPAESRIHVVDEAVKRELRIRQSLKLFR